MSLTCPMCKKSLGAPSRQCPRCAADLTLLVDFADHLQGGLARAERLTRAGELGEAVWAYLEVLEIDPDNPTARRQVGRVATAVRQFDRASAARRWLDRLRRQEHFRHWLESWHPGREVVLGIAAILVLLLLAGCLALGYYLGHRAGQRSGSPPLAAVGSRAAPFPTPDRGTGGQDLKERSECVSAPFTGQPAERCRPAVDGGTSA